MYIIFMVLAIALTAPYTGNKNRDTKMLYTGECKEFIVKKQEASTGTEKV